MDKYERKELLENAQDKINEGIELIRQALKDTTHERHAEAYIIGHLDNWANGGNPYDETIPTLVEKISAGSEYNLVWYRGEQVVGEETSEFDNDQDAYAYAELKANNEYNADDFEANEVVR